MLDRLDLHVEVPPVDFAALNSNTKEESSKEIRARVNKARKIQVERYKGTGITCNAHLTPSMPIIIFTNAVILFLSATAIVSIIALSRITRLWQRQDLPPRSCLSSAFPNLAESNKVYFPTTPV
jgi:hypothetical protein